MERYICIHGHFYQPPRENPWLEAVEMQDSAYPYHDWNERIDAECYAPNAASRILDGKGRITQIVNNYSKISFNFGPTLLAWLEAHAPETYRAILTADHASRERYSGHGSALAQAYNHLIMPLADERDRRTQVRWGIRDFEHRFDRAPEGMWLPETAVDIATLEALAEQDIRFTILAPHQARRVRRIGEREWHELDGASIDPTRAYLQRLPSGRSIVVFFYDGPVSRGVAFEQLLRNGERFARRLTDAFSDRRDWPQLVHIATDGETYGHHHRHGDMALSYALDHIESEGLARLTNYGEHLERQPPTHEVDILEDSSWSCVHGIERWRSDCGCHTGGEPGWSQAWRAPLRKALDELRDAAAPAYEAAADGLLHDPWAARDDYIDVILDRDAANVDAFFDRHAERALSDDETVRALELLELQRHAMLMYTSCGWFFNELSGIETVQVLEYAGRAVQLAEALFDEPYEAVFLDGLARARSNRPEHDDGRSVYEAMVRPRVVTLPRVGAHFAVSSLFRPYRDSADVYAYTVDVRQRGTRTAGRARLVVGHVRAASEITRETAELQFGVMYFGGHSLTGGVGPYTTEEAYRRVVDETNAAFERGDFPQVVRVLDAHFAPDTFALGALLGDEQRTVIDGILTSTLADAEIAYRRIYETHAPLMRFLSDMSLPLPDVLDMSAEFVLNARLNQAVTADALDIDRIRSLLDEARRSNVALDTAGLGYALEGAIEGLADRLQRQPTDRARLDALADAVDLARSVPFSVNLWSVQNIYYDLLRRAYPEVRRRTDGGEGEAAAWTARFETLGRALSVAVD